MKILLGSQFYTPSIGGVQEVMRQLGEELVLKGHDVTIVTTSDPKREFNTLNGVKIAEFNISGNFASGMVGEVEKFHEFVIDEKFDALMVMAAQQWTFDALWPILDKLPNTRKVLIPCGFSGLYDPLFKKYFEDMPAILNKFDHLVFHSTKYRDIDFARQNEIEHFSVLPCGASHAVFDVETDQTFRSRHNINEHDFLFLTVGSFTGLKGHKELLKAFKILNLPEGESATLILNGNVVSSSTGGTKGFVQKLISLIKTRGVSYLIEKVLNKLKKKSISTSQMAAELTASSSNKTVIITDFERAELTQAFMNSDLFVFASNIEYSPLVLFETVAAGTPFLSVSVGNSPELASWLKAGIICPSEVNEAGYTVVDEKVLASEMHKLMKQKDYLQQLGEEGRENWKNNFTWKTIAEKYEKILLDLVKEGTAKKAQES